MVGDGSFLFFIEEVIINNPQLKSGILDMSSQSQKIKVDKSAVWAYSFGIK